MPFNLSENDYSWSHRMTFHVAEWCTEWLLTDSEVSTGSAEPSIGWLLLSKDGLYR